MHYCQQQHIISSKLLINYDIVENSNKSVYNVRGKGRKPTFEKEV
nr:MAG TPA: hypothetical protein [Caudoviricetes sp.]